MTPTLTQVRTALQNLAAKKGRPDYELCTVKAVKRALENGTDHHLIEDVLPLIAAPKVVVEEAVVVKPKRPKHLLWNCMSSGDYLLIQKLRLN